MRNRISICHRIVPAAMALGVLTAAACTNNPLERGLTGGGIGAGVGAAGAALTGGNPWAGAAIGGAVGAAAGVFTDESDVDLDGK